MLSRLLLCVMTVVERREGGEGVGRVLTELH